MLGMIEESRGAASSSSADAVIVIRCVAAAMPGHPTAIGSSLPCRARNEYF